MAIDFAALKKNRSNTLSKLAEDAAKFSNKFDEDKRFWKLTYDKAGNGLATIRFLGEAQGEDFYFARYYDFGFKGPGGWYIEKSLETVGLPDPAQEHVNSLWAKVNAGDDSFKELARERSKRTNFVSNILVVNDTANPENNGKQFLFRYGKEIFEMVSNPDPGIDPMNLWEGNNFRLKSRRKDGGFISYDRSMFEETKTAVAESDAEIERIWSAMYPLREWSSPDKYKTYDELKTRLNTALGETGGARTQSRSSADIDDAAPVAPRPERRAAAEPAKATSTPPWEDEKDDDVIVFDRSEAGKRISPLDDDDDLKDFDDLVKN